MTKTLVYPYQSELPRLLELCLSAFIRHLKRPIHVLASGVEVGSSRRRFSREFKLEAVRRVEETDRSQAQVAEELDINAHTLGRWMRLFRSNPKAWCCGAFPVYTATMALHPDNQDGTSGAAVSRNPLDRFLGDQALVILDGGLATGLEARGHDLNDPMWSAKLLIEAPDAIGDLHQTYLMAGADCITTATYQASLPGFRNRGLGDDEGAELMRLAVRLAVEARARFWADKRNRQDRLFPAVAASVGPYGAYLADGSEYKGDYTISDSQLYDFHRGRWRVLAESAADLLACETIPSSRETAVLLQLLDDTPDCQAWMSFSCQDGLHICDGTRVREVMRLCDKEPKVIAIGINCTAPGHISSLVAEARGFTDKMIIVYPNLGEQYDAATKTWGSGLSEKNWLDSVDDWVGLGVLGIGGCCRIGPEMISELRRRLLG